MPVGVVDRVVDDQICERHIADRCIEVIRAEGRVREGLCADGGARVEGLRDVRGHGVKLDAGHVGALGGKSDERAAARARFEYPTALEAEPTEGIPGGGDVGRVGVVRVEDGSTGLRVLVVVEELT